MWHRRGRDSLLVELRRLGKLPGLLIVRVLWCWWVGSSADQYVLVMLPPPLGRSCMYRLSWMLLRVDWSASWQSVPYISLLGLFLLFVCTSSWYGPPLGMALLLVLPSSQCTLLLTVHPPLDSAPPS